MRHNFSFLSHGSVCAALSLLILSFPCRAQPRGDVGTMAARGTGTITFVENRGQIVDDRGRQRPDLLAMGRAHGVTMYLAKDRLYYVYADLSERLRAFHRNDCNPEPGKYAGDTPDGYPHPDSVASRIRRVEMEFVGADPDVRMEPSDPTAVAVNYYLPQCPRGIIAARTYRGAIYHNLYPNVDLVMRASASGTKYDFVVRPGGRVTDIRVRYNGADDVAMSAGGSVRVASLLGNLVEGAPYSYQNAPDAPATVASRYVLRGDTLSFDVGAYDASRTLIIDPAQEWATFYGGTSTEDIIGGNPITVAADGSILMVGYTTSTQFPTTASAIQTVARGAIDAFITRFDAHGNVHFSTYYGGAADDLAHGVAVDADGNTFVTGHTASTNLPLASAFQSAYQGGTRDGFLVKLSPTGALLWGTYCGTAFWDDPYGMAIDGAGNPCILMTTRGATMSGTAGPVVYKRTRDISHPTSSGSPTANELLCVKYDGESGTVAWATFIGGTAEDFGYGLAIDGHDDVVLHGWTSSNDFPVTAGCAQPLRGGGYDCFLAKIDSSGLVQWSTYFGGPADEDVGLGNSVGSGGIAVDGARNITLAGSTGSGFPTTLDAWHPTPRGATDAFAAQFAPDGSLRWSTYVGAAGNDYALSCAVNTLGEVVLAGSTNSTALETAIPGISPAFQAQYGGGANDAFIVKLRDGGVPSWVTYFGGAGNDEAFGLGCARDEAIALIGTTTTSGGLPFARQGRYQAEHNQPVTMAANNGGGDLFVTLFCDMAPVRVDSTGPRVLHKGETLLLRVDSGRGAIRWYRRATPGAGAEEIPAYRGNPALTIADSGEYFASVENTAGCLVQSEGVIVRRAADSVSTVGTGVSEGLAGRIRILRAEPDQSGATVRVEYELAADAQAEIALFDLSGRRVAWLPSSRRAAGRHAADFDVRALAGGSYLCVLNASGMRVSRLLSVVR